jgi:hypothetical protein
MKEQPFTIWTKPALQGIRPAFCSEYAMIFGVRDFSDIMFRYAGNLLYAHTGKGTTPDATAVMTRRNS